MKIIQIVIILISLNFIAQASSLKDTIIVSTAGGAICKIYAEEVGGDVEAFSNMNAGVMQIAEKMGYTNNMQSYISEVNKAKKVLQHLLLQKHGSKLNIYNDWCIKFYNGYQKGLAKAYN